MPGKHILNIRKLNFKKHTHRNLILIKRNKNMNNFSSLQSNLVCSISSQEHIIRDPRRLPCKRTCCLSCIESLAESNHKFKCKFCSLTHDTLKEIRRDLICEEALEENLPILADHEANRLNLVTSSTLELFSGSQNAIEGLFEFYRYEIELRFESVRAALDIAASDFLKTIEIDFSQGLDKVASDMKEVEHTQSMNRSLPDSERLLKKLSIISIDIFYCVIC